MLIKCYLLGLRCLDNKDNNNATYLDKDNNNNKNNKNVTYLGVAPR